MRNTLVNETLTNIIVCKCFGRCRSIYLSLFQLSVSLSASK